MPRDLPGFYFDDEKQRYFPISSKPASKPVSVKADPPKLHSNNPSKPSSFSRQNLKRKRGSISSNNMDNMRRSINPAQNQRFMQFVWFSRQKSLVNNLLKTCYSQITCSKIASTSRMTKVPLPYPTQSSITSFKVNSIYFPSRMDLLVLTVYYSAW